MAGALVGGAFLSAFLQVAFDRLASRDFLDFLKGRKDIDGSLKKLKKLLRSANVVLVDAEDKQYTNPSVKEWLDELQHAVYGADDILDEIGYEALRRKVSGLIPTSVDSFNTRIKSELEAILNELESLTKEKDDLGLEKVAGGVPPRPLTNFLPEEYGVFGRDNDREAIFQKFESDDAAVNGPCVVPIQSKGNEGMEEIGKRYFDDLVSRSLFQQSSTNESRFIMHDLVNDLATFISGEFCFRLEEDNELNEITEKTRHFSCYEGGFDDSKKFEILYVAKGSRTFLGELKRSWEEHDNIGKMVGDLWKEFKALRVLSLSDFRVMELPDFVDNLKQLRYLNIRNTEIKHLPDSLCNLYYLQTLILPSYITKLPTNMSKLINLRCLDNSRAKMEEMPPHMDKLKNLRKLSVFGVGIHDDGSSIKELGELQHLSGKLSLLNLENVQCINKDNTEVILKNKQDLSELKLEWKHGHGTKDSEKERILLEQLCPCTNLNSLTITNYEGTSFPKWLGDSSFSKMVCIELRNCDNCFCLPPLGQLPNLKRLQIECFGKISSVGPEFYGNTINPFRALEYLSFENMPEWQEWVLFEGEVFTCLRQLRILRCPKLSGGLPVQPPSLTKLDISGEVRVPEEVRVYLAHAIFSYRSKKLAAEHRKRVQYSPALHGKSVNIEFGVCSILPCLSEFASVTHLKLILCPDLVSFPSGGLCAPNLSEIVIVRCENLESLPEGMRTLLPSLVRLELLGCPKLNSFPEGGLPSSLESLLICECDTLFSRRMQWGLQDLRSLRSFTIIDECNKLASFPEDALLPPNLTDLYITLSNLKSLNGKGFQHLTSLKHLKIWSCDDLDCLLEEVLPPSLCELDICNCLLLEERYGEEKGEGWVKIAHIPRISISTNEYDSDSDSDP
nr:putative disease resistance rpp13-like protein 1 [Quercus suber]